MLKKGGRMSRMREQEYKIEEVSWIGRTCQVTRSTKQVHSCTYVTERICSEAVIRRSKAC
eukprot:765518-Hanusia_phi.AAC.10